MSMTPMSCSILSTRVTETNRHIWQEDRHIWQEDRHTYLKVVCSRDATNHSFSETESSQAGSKPPSSLKETQLNIGYASAFLTLEAAEAGIPFWAS